MAKLHSSAKNSVSLVLKEIWEARQAKNSSYSIRAFARDLGMSAGFLSQVMSGNKRLSAEKAQFVADALKLPERQRRLFLKAVTLSSMNSAEAEKLFSTPGYVQDYEELEVDRFQYFNNWYHVAIADLTTCLDFQPDIFWIGDRLDLPSEIVKDSLERLVRLGVLKKEAQTYIKTNAFVSIPTVGPSNTIRNFHLQMIEKARQTLDRQTQEDFERRNISCITFSVSPSKIEEAKQRITSFRRELADLCEPSQGTELYQLNVQFFPLTGTKRKSS